MQVEFKVPLSSILHYLQRAAIFSLVSGFIWTQFLAKQLQFHLRNAELQINAAIAKELDEERCSSKSHKGLLLRSSIWDTDHYSITSRKKGTMTFFRRTHFRWTLFRRTDFRQSNKWDTFQTSKQNRTFFRQDIFQTHHESGHILDSLPLLFPGILNNNKN